MEEWVKPEVLAELMTREVPVDKESNNDVFSAGWQNGCCPLLF